jgi:hypothetical protein
MDFTNKFLNNESDTLQKNQPIENGKRKNSNSKITTENERSNSNPKITAENERSNSNPKVIAAKLGTLVRKLSGRRFSNNARKNSGNKLEDNTIKNSNNDCSDHNNNNDNANNNGFTIKLNNKPPVPNNSMPTLLGNKKRSTSIFELNNVTLIKNDIKSNANHFRSKSENNLYTPEHIKENFKSPRTCRICSLITTSEINTDPLIIDICSYCLKSTPSDKRAIFAMAEFRNKNKRISVNLNFK